MNKRLFQPRLSRCLRRTSRRPARTTGWSPSSSSCPPCRSTSTSTPTSPAASQRSQFSLGIFFFPFRICIEYNVFLYRICLLLIFFIIGFEGNCFVICFMQVELLGTEADWRQLIQKLEDIKKVRMGKRDC